MKAYKLFRLRKNGSLSPLFINKKQLLPISEWIPAEPHPTKGFKFRPYWHCMSAKLAPHLSKKNRIWCEIEIKDYHTIERPKKQGGLWYLAKWLKINKILKHE